MPNPPLSIKIAVPVIGLLLAVGVIVVAVGVFKAWWSLPFSPVEVTAEQPIEFPHDVHASPPKAVVQDGSVADPQAQIALSEALEIDPEVQVGDEVGLGIDCLFCHRTANSDEAASIPAVQQCMYCHQVVERESPEVAKLIAASENGDPINWVRVHRLPDHVQFVHEAHIRFFSQQNNVAPSEVCSICHGDVTTMKVAEQVRNLKMRDCVDCHRSGYLDYLTEDSAAAVQQAVRTGHLAAPPTDCFACHY